MLTLTSTLLAAQQKYDVQPVVKVMVSDNPPEAPRLSELASLYNGTEPDVTFDAAAGPDGYVTRVYVDASGNVWGQWVAGNGTGWGSWTKIATTGATGGQGACCCYAIAGGAYAFWADASGHVLWQSTFNGSTWGAPVQVLDAGAGWLIQSVACDSNDPTLRLIYVLAGGQLYETHWTGSAWSTPVGDGGTWSSPTIAYGYRPSAAPNGDGNGYVLVSYTTGGQSTLLTKQLNILTGSPGWQGTTQLLQYGVNAGYSGAYPRIQETRGDVRRQAITWVETPPSPGVATPLVVFTCTHNLLTQVVPWRYPTSATKGIKVLKSSATAFGGPYWWVIGANQVYRCPADTSAGGQRVSFSQSQVEQLRIDTQAQGSGGRISVTVANENGALSNAGVPGSANQALRPWSQLVIALGYHTSAGDETVWQLPCWIDQIVFHDDAASGVPLVMFHAIDGWGLLDELRFPWTQSWSGVDAGTLLGKLIKHVSGDLTWSPPGQLTAIQPTGFTWHAGETLGSAARRLCELGGVILFFRTFATSADGSGWDSVQPVTKAWAQGGSVYTYQQELQSQGFLAANVHPIVASQVAPLVVPSATSVEVVGASTTSKARNWSPTWLLWRDLQSRLVDKTLDSQAKTDTAASQMATLLAPEGLGGEMTTLANVGIEVGDQVTVTIATAPVTNQVMTVAGITTSWDRVRGVLLQTLLLEGTN